MEDDYCLSSEDVELSKGQALSEIDIARELETFRQQWYNEIQGNDDEKARRNVLPLANKSMVEEHQSNWNRISHPEEPTIEDQAQYLFLQGVGAEQAGRLYDAIQYYRKAVQLVPDIESRIDFSFKQRARVRQESECSLTVSDAGEMDDELTDLIHHIQRIHCAENPNYICLPSVDQKVMHIGELPVEIIQYIFKWVVSGDLDVYSLEQLACVSRGFYLCARDEELWRLVCIRIWGMNCGSPSKYGSYRNMYIERPHLRFNGCYISKCVYYRSGEKGLDNLYRPVHRVEYFRYVRFFPDGKVLMLTSPDDPYVVLPNLNYRGSAIQGLLCGYYKLTGDRVTMVLKKVQTAGTDYQPAHRYRRMKNAQSGPDREHTFEAEFSVASVRARPCWMLIWARYSLRTYNRITQEDTVNDFELTSHSYPSLYFSRVRSFNSVSNSRLC